jgi:carbamoyl-phosphate synthase small subunit
MVGYPETLTDPSYNGQIPVCTYPLIGNYGIPKDQRENNLSTVFESERIHVRALIVSDYSAQYSHWSAEKSLSTWMEEQNIPGIYGIDTRKLTKRLREQGVMLGKVVMGKAEDLKFEDPNKTNLVAEVSFKLF